MKKDKPFFERATWILLFFICIIFILVVAKGFLYPIALALLISYLLFPIASFLEKRWYFPRIVSNLVAILTGIAIVGGISSFIYLQLKGILTDIGPLKQQALANADKIKSSIESFVGIRPEFTDKLLRNTLLNGIEGGNKVFGQIFANTSETIVRIGFLPVYIFLMLYYRNKFHEFIRIITPVHLKQSMEIILQKTSKVTTKYMTGMFIVVCILCVLNSLGFYVIGLKYAILLGIIAAICNFIPYFGAIIGYLFPFLFALVTENSPHYAFMVAGQFFIIQFTENNLLIPNIVGNNVSLNPFVIILGMFGSAMVWGLPGMLVIVPLLAAIKIFCENTPNLQAYGFLMGTEGTEKHAITIEKIKKLFIRK
jgi:predicted PurR-regulated permease PerM